MNTLIESPVESSVQNSKDNLKNSQRTLAPFRVLVLEDDKSQWPLWESVINDLDAEAEIDWSTREVDAEALIRHAFQTNNPYNVIISDVFLSGNENGVDLWNRYGETASNFIFVSVINPSQFNDLIEPKLTAKLGCPFYLQKPLTMETCKKAMQVMSKNKNEQINKGGQNE